MYGANGPYLPKGSLQFNQSFRGFTSKRHFSGTKEQTVREDYGNNVINEQRIADFGFTYGVTESTAVTLSIPYLLYGSWAAPLPIGPPFQPTETKGPYYKQSSEGLGDISLTARHWMLDTVEHTDQNFSLGLGVKAPTGESNYMQDYPNLLGEDIKQRSVDQSIQPGDGGWGAIFDFNGFKDTKYCTLYVSGTYLFNPQNTNDTLSVVSNLLGESVVQPELRYNSIPDQYLFVAGAAFPITPVPGLATSLAWRIEGVPPEDLIGEDEGWRRPGYATFIEPGVSYAYKASVFSVSVPVRLIANRQDNFLDQPGDATFADWMLLIGFQFNF